MATSKRTGKKIEITVGPDDAPEAGGCFWTTSAAKVNTDWMAERVDSVNEAFRVLVENGELTPGVYHFDSQERIEAFLDHARPLLL